MPNFPASLDALSNPGPTTKRNAPGFELDVVVAALNDIAEALEGKVGITDSPASDTPVANTVLTSLANGKSGWAKVVTAMLAAGAVSQVVLATPTGSNPAVGVIGVYSDLDVQASITTTGGTLLAFLAASIQNSTAGNTLLAMRLDSNAEVGAMNITVPVATAAVQFACFSRFTGVSAGAHLVTARWRSLAGTATALDQYRYLLVVELKA